VSVGISVEWAFLLGWAFGFVIGGAAGYMVGHWRRERKPE
jgi:branched-subunit amino acid ABC-type transport system permease component